MVHTAFLLAVTACAHLLASPATALPTHTFRLRKRAQALEDRDFLNYILSVDQLQAAFYRFGLDHFTDSDFKDSGYPSRIKSEITTIHTQDSDQAALIIDAINGLEEEYYGSQNRDPVTTCKYNWTFTDVGDFIAQASILEQTSVSAHLGIQQRLSNRTLKSTIASLSSVQSRHSTLINILNNERNNRNNRTALGDPLPNKIETPLGIRPVLSILDRYIKSCPDDAIYKPLSELDVEEAEVDNPWTYGDEIGVEGFDFTKSDRDEEKLQCVFVYGVSQISSPVSYRRASGDDNDEDDADTSNGDYEATCEIPEVQGYGLLALFITNDDNPVELEGTNDNVVAGPAWVSIQQDGRGITV
ncbi:hypothetical protein HDV00_001297 [Rhizophlyctis rosea]|nr:hypothetical protein HDV00_001297 [Rhizophlyctis rosea]